MKNPQKKIKGEEVESYILSLLSSHGRTCSVDNGYDFEFEGCPVEEKSSELIVKNGRSNGKNAGRFWLDVEVARKFKSLSKADITTRVVLTTLLPVVVMIPTLGLFGIEAIPAITFSALLPEWVTRTMLGIVVSVFLILWLYFIPRNIYGTYKMLQWYNQVKGGMTKTNYKR